MSAGVRHSPVPGGRGRDGAWILAPRRNRSGTFLSASFGRTPTGIGARSAGPVDAKPGPA